MLLRWTYCHFYVSCTYRWLQGLGKCSYLSCHKAYSVLSDHNIIKPSVLTYGFHLPPCFSASCFTVSYNYNFQEMFFTFQFHLFIYPHNITSRLNTIYLLANFPQIISLSLFFVLGRSRPLASNFKSPS